MLFSLLLFACSCLAVNAAVAGNVDESFVVGLPADPPPRRMPFAALPDGSAIFHTNLVRPNGMFDRNFRRSPAINSSTTLYKLLPDGRFLAAGSNLVVLPKPASLTPDFTISFSGCCDEETVQSVLVLQNGDIVLTGQFSSVSGVPRQRIAAITPSGELLQVFANFSITSSERIYALAEDSAGKILLGGGVLTINGRIRYLARVTMAGSLDESFNPILDHPDPLSVQSAAIQPNGRIVIGGYFSTVEDVISRGVARLNSDGSVDRSFQLPTTQQFKELRDVRHVQLDPSGRILFGGSLGGRLLSSGALDTTFPLEPWVRPSFGPDAHYYVQVTESPYVFQSVGLPFGIGRLSTNNALDLSFNYPGPNGAIHQIEPLPDGRLYIGGGFYIASNPIRAGFARLLSDGRLDPSFVPLSHTQVKALKMTPEGLLVAGSFYENDPSYDYPLLKRFREDGSVDPNFNFSGIDSYFARGGVIQSLAVDANGLVYYSGNFTVGQTRSNLFRLLPTGQLDTSFDAEAAPRDISSILPLPDGKVLVASSSILRFLPNGARDTTFSRPGFPAVRIYDWAQHNTWYAAKPITTLIRSPNGDYLFGSRGDFFQISYGNVISGGALKLDSSGQFVEVLAYYAPALSFQPDGKILIGGSAVQRLLPDASIDPAFESPPIYADFPSTSQYDVLPPGVLAARADSVGDILVGGDFSLNGTRTYLVRLHGDRSIVPLRLSVRNSDGDPGINLTGPPEFKASLQSSSNLTDWIDMETRILTSGAASFTNPISSSNQFFRAKLVR